MLDEACLAAPCRSFDDQRYLCLEGDSKRCLLLVLRYVVGLLSDLELVDVDGDTVKVRFRGACSGCIISAVTLKDVVEARLK